MVADNRVMQDERRIRHALLTYFRSQGLTCLAVGMTPVYGKIKRVCFRVHVNSTEKYWIKVLKTEVERLLINYPDMYIGNTVWVSSSNTPLTFDVLYRDE